MRYLMSLLALALICVVPQANAAERFSSPLELSLTGGFSDGPGYANRAPHGALTLDGGTHMFRLHATASGSLMHKTETPGGYWAGLNGGVDVRFGGFTVHGGMTTSHTDQKIWTKRVRYAYGGLGYRWNIMPNPQGIPREIHVIKAEYFQETFSTYANHARVCDFSYQYYRRLGGSLYFHAKAVVGPMFFRNGPQPDASHRKGLSSNFGIGLSLLPN